jgi:hypothetical protein
MSYVGMIVHDSYVFSILFCFGRLERFRFSVRKRARSFHVSCSLTARCSMSSVHRIQS